MWRSLRWKPEMAKMASEAIQHGAPSWKRPRVMAISGTTSAMNAKVRSAARGRGRGGSKTAPLTCNIAPAILWRRTRSVPAAAWRGCGARRSAARSGRRRRGETRARRTRRRPSAVRPSGQLVHASADRFQTDAEESVASANRVEPRRAFAARRAPSQEHRVERQPDGESNAFKSPFMRSYSKPVMGVEMQQGEALIGSTTDPLIHCLLRSPRSMLYGARCDSTEARDLPACLSCCSRPYPPLAQRLRGWHRPAHYQQPVVRPRSRTRRHDRIADLLADE